MEKKLTELIDKALTRRSFMTRSGAAAAAVVVAGCGGGSTPAPTPTPTPTPTPAPAALGDSDYLNFALNLEYLEAEFYLRAATGSGLAAADTGNTTSTVTVPSTTMVPGLTTAQQNYIYEIAQNELDHVRFLRSALGSSAVAEPNIDLMNSFNAAASAAGIGSSFNPFASYEAFLVGAFVFEDVGVTAYHGAAGLLSNTMTGKTYLAAAASILAVEAYHAAEIRTLLIADSSRDRGEDRDSGLAQQHLRDLRADDKQIARDSRRRQRNHTHRASTLRCSVCSHRVHAGQHHRCCRSHVLNWICPHHGPGAAYRLCRGSRRRRQGGRLFPQRNERQHQRNR